MLALKTQERDLGWEDSRAAIGNAHATPFPPYPPGALLPKSLGGVVAPGVIKARHCSRRWGYTWKQSGGTPPDLPWKQMREFGFL